MEGTCDAEETKSEEETSPEETSPVETSPVEAPPVEAPCAEGNKQEIFYYWPILPEELCQRWQVEKATR